MCFSIKTGNRRTARTTSCSKDLDFDFFCFNSVQSHAARLILNSVCQNKEWRLLIWHVTVTVQINIGPGNAAWGNERELGFVSFF